MVRPVISDARMDNFAFVIHPLAPKRDVVRRYPLLGKVLPKSLIHFFARFWPPVYISHVTGIRSRDNGKEIEGWLVACPFTARQMLRLPPERVYNKIVRTGRLAQRQGANLLGLGAFTSVIGDGGVTVAERLAMPVTTGNSLTVGLVVDALRECASDRGVWLELSTAAVVGATGSIGVACVEMMAPLVRDMVLVGRRDIDLARARARAEAAGGQQVYPTKNLDDIRCADLVISATSAADPIIYSRHLKKEAIVCDVALPADVAPSVKEEREDVVIIKGGIVDVPGDVDFHFNFGLPPGQAYACMAETMVLALEGRYENYSLGKEIQIEKVHEITRLARRHGFRLAADQGG